MARWPQWKRLCAAICDRVAAGESLAKICTGGEMPTPVTFMSWTREDPELADRWTDARRALAQLKYDQAWELVRDLEDASGLKLKVDVLRWQAAQAPSKEAAKAAPQKEQIVFKRAKL